MNRFHPYTELLGRILLAAIFVLSGWSKIGGYAGTQGYMQAAGVPGALLPLVILLELGGGIAIVLGLFTRWVALALALFSIAAAVLFHGKLGDQMQFVSFFKNLAMAGGFLLLFTHGAGPLSLDARRAKR
ncbi:MAG TPA: DoxX family protein [Solimonas sp.]|nr:DoxX family protein [Solimonas sp.]